VAAAAIGRRCTACPYGDIAATVRLAADVAHAAAGGGLGVAA